MLGGIFHLVARAEAPSQGSVLQGANPSVYDPKNPIILFIIQACIILCMCRLLHFPLAYLREPRVVGEVLGGILLGPSVFGHIPGFTETIFPPQSIPNLSNVANLGLILFLFTIGLQIDLRYFFRNWKVALSVAATGMTIPFSLGAALSYGIYHTFEHEDGTEPVAYGTFLLFVGVSMAITAFPVLCRIITELKLLSTPVGIITLASGVGDDVVGWVLLALCVALVNASSGITALYIVLCVVGWALFMAFALRPCFMWLLRRTHSLQDGPTQGVMVVTILLCLGSAFFTGVIGVHPIFGAFLAGLIMPHEGGFAIKVTEKIEDLMMTLFLPLYFTLSGLSTNLGLLNDGITWAYLIAIVVVAFVSKFFGCTVAARLNGLVWRESFSVGALMSCKGLVELIVLNVGLQAKILSTRVFTMFVVMALVTTFATTPLVSFLYPPSYQKKLAAWKRGEIDWDTGLPIHDGGGNSSDDNPADQAMSARENHIKSLLIYLRLDNMPNTLAFVSLFGCRPGESVHPHHDSDAAASAREVEQQKKPIISIHGMRVVQLTARLGSVMTVSELDSLGAFDPVLNAFRVLGQMYNFAVSGEVAVVPSDLFADSLVTRAAEESSDLLLLPWTETGSLSEAPMVSKNTIERKLRSDAYSDFIAETLDTHCGACAVFFNKNFSGSIKQSPAALTRRLDAAVDRPAANDNPAELPAADRGHHIFVPFFGGADGRAAVRLSLQLASNPELTLTVTHYSIRSEELASSPPSSSSETVETKSVALSGEKIRIAPVTAGGGDTDHDFFLNVQRHLPDRFRARVTFRTSISFDPVSEAVGDAAREVGRNPSNGGDLVVLGRNVPIVEPGASRCLGLVADLLLESGVEASVVVTQAKREEPRRGDAGRV